MWIILVFSLLLHSCDWRLWVHGWYPWTEEWRLNWILLLWRISWVVLLFHHVRCPVAVVLTQLWWWCSSWMYWCMMNVERCIHICVRVSVVKVSTEYIPDGYSLYHGELWRWQAARSKYNTIDECWDLVPLWNGIVIRKLHGLLLLDELWRSRVYCSW